MSVTMLVLAVVLLYAIARRCRRRRLVRRQRAATSPWRGCLGYHRRREMARLQAQDLARSIVEGDHDPPCTWRLV